VDCCDRDELLPVSEKAHRIGTLDNAWISLCGDAFHLCTQLANLGRGIKANKINVLEKAALGEEGKKFM
jgi:hypothetical protein